MEWNWARLAAHLKAARLAMRPRVTQPAMGSRIGVSLATIQSIEGGKEFEKVTPTIRAFAREVGWTSDSPEKVLEGGDPAIAADSEPPAAAEPSRAAEAAAQLAALPVEVQAALAREGKVVDASVTDVELPGISGEMIVVFKKRPSVPPETAARDLHEMALRYLKLRGIDPEDSETEGGDDAGSAARA